jgi:hypothetical protein
MVDDKGKETVKPSLGDVINNKHSSVEKICSTNMRVKDGLVQIAPYISGVYETDFMPKKLHSCYFTNCSAGTRNLIMRASYDDSYKEDFINWWHANREPLYRDYYIQYTGNVPTQKLTVEHWLESKTGDKLREYTEAYDRLIQNQFMDEDDLDACKSHVKVDEKCLSIEKTRNITAQNSISKVLMGPIVEISSSAHKVFDNSYGTGVNWDYRQHKYNKNISKFIDPVKIDIDGSGYDGTQWDWLKSCVDTSRYLFIFNLVEHIYSLNPDYCKYVLSSMTQIVKNKKIDWSYTVEGTVGSGFMSTSDGNTVRSGDLIRFGFRNSKYVEGVHYFLETCGDDVIIITERSYADSMKSLLFDNVYTADNTKGKLGQIAKYININEIDEGNYLSTVWVKKNDLNEIRIMRQPERVLCFTPWTYNNMKGTDEREDKLNAELAIANAGSILSWAKGISFYEEYAKMLIKSANMRGVYHTTIKLDDWSNRFCSDDENINEQFHHFLAKNYSIDESDLYEYYSALSNISSPYEVVRLRLIDKLIKTEGSEIRNVDYINHIVDNRSRLYIRNSTFDTSDCFDGSANTRLITY